LVLGQNHHYYRHQNTSPFGNKLVDYSTQNIVAQKLINCICPFHKNYFRPSCGKQEFSWFYSDDQNVSPTLRAQIEFKVELIDTLFKMLTPMGYKLTIVPSDDRVQPI
jgi:hypothetical protein